MPGGLGPSGMSHQPDWLGTRPPPSQEAVGEVLVEVGVGSIGGAHRDRQCDDHLPASHVTAFAYSAEGLGSAHSFSSSLQEPGFKRT